MIGMHFELPLLKWCEWDAATQPALPPLSFIEPMVRRRLSSLAKMSLWVAHECAHDHPDVRMVYASRHGELQRTTEMLADLAAAQPLSPTAFSMSVLNASIGLYSIVQSNTAASIAISAGEETLAAALLEVRLQLNAHPQAAVLLIYADEPVPAVLQAVTEHPEVTAHALALLFKADPVAMSLQVHQGALAAAGTTQAQSFAAGLRTRQAASWGTSETGWTWAFA